MKNTPNKVHSNNVWLANVGATCLNLKNCPDRLGLYISILYHSNKHSVFIEIYILSYNTENYSSCILAWLWYRVSGILTYVHDNVSVVNIPVWI